MRFLALLKHDIRFQFRQGLYHVYLVLTLLYIGALYLLPVEARQRAALFIIFLDPSVMGFFFIGGIIMLERGQDTLESLFVTPVRVAEYIAAKVITLTVIALIAGFAIMLALFGRAFNPLALFAGVTLTSIFFTLCGITIASLTTTVNGYLILAGVVTPIFFLPFLEYFGLSSPLYYLFPTRGALNLLEAMYGKTAGGELLYAIITLPIFCLVAYIGAHKRFKKAILCRIGEK